MSKKQTKHFIYYHTSFGRNDGPPLFYFYNLQKLFGKKNVLHLIPEGDIYRYGKADYHWWIDYGEDGLPVDHTWKIPEDGGKKIYVVSDAHIDPKGAEYRFKKAIEFDYVFFNQEHYIHEFGEWFKHHYQIEVRALPPDMKLPQIQYLPHAAEPQAYPHFKILPKYDVCFIGHMQEFHVGNSINMTRIDFLDAMFKEFPNFYFGGRSPVWPEKNMFEDASKHFCESKIVLNISIGNDLNMRFFETLMSGSFLLTNWIPELKNAEKYGFIDGVHYISYKTLKEAIQKTKHYLSHNKERDSIAKAGYKQALRTGTYKSRIEEILKLTG